MSKLFKLTARTIFSFTAIFLLAGLTGCASQKIDLTYSSLGPSMSATEGLSAVMVSEFTNGIPSPEIGNDDGAVFEANSSPTTWVTQAFTDELIRLGVHANYSPYSSSSQYIVKGRLDQFWVETTGPSQYSVKIAITLELPQTASGVLFIKKYNAEHSSALLLNDADLSELVEETLRDVVTRAALEIKAQLPKM